MKQVSSLFFSLLTIGIFGQAMAAETTATATSTSNRVGGFVDAQARYSNDAQSNTFFIKDGALYWDATLGGAAVKVDIPFATKGAVKSESVITNSGGTPTGVATTTTVNNDFVIATQKAQAFVGYLYDSGVRWKLGQFDKIHGISSNDSVDSVYTTGSVLKARGHRVTHTGALVGYGFGSFEVDLLAANPANQGILNDRYPEYGAKIGSNFGDWTFNIGGLHNKLKIGDGARTMYNLEILARLGDLKLGAEALCLKSDKNAATGLGGLVQLTYPITSEDTLGIRGEYLTKVSTNRDIQGTLAWNHAFTRGFRTKLDYAYGLSKMTAGDTIAKAHTVHVGGVYAF